MTTIIEKKNNLRKTLYRDLRLFRGAINEVSRRSGKNRNWVRQVLTKEETAGADVILVAVEVLNEYQEKRDKENALILKAVRATA